MPAKLVEEVRDAWLEGQHLLEQLPPLSSDHETVRLAVVQLKQTYARLSKAATISHDVRAECERTMSESLRLILSARDRLQRR
jgi:hypothetical protein